MNVNKVSFGLKMDLADNDEYRGMVIKVEDGKHISREKAERTTFYLMHGNILIKRGDGSFRYISNNQLWKGNPVDIKKGEEYDIQALEDSILLVFMESDKNGK